MLSGLLSVFKSGIIAKSYLQTLLNLIQHFEADFVQDGNARNAAIDDACQYLQSLKVPTPAPVASPSIEPTE
jgi:hypothetical protein